MAIYHMNVGFVSRSTGRSAVQCAAYISGEKLHESRRDLPVDYRNRHSDIAFCQTFAPNHAPEWMKDLSVWDKLESFEDTYALQRYKSDETREKYLGSAQTAQTYVMALPKELSPQVWQELMTEFVNERFVSRNLIATLAIHNDEGNPHAHIMVSRRSVTMDGEFSFAKDREITTKIELKETRKLWADKANFYLEREGFDARIDHRSFADLGIAFEPTKKEGWFANMLEERGDSSRIVVENQEIKHRNKAIAILDPETILSELTANKATFSLDQLARQIQMRVGDDVSLCQAVFEQAQSKSVHVGVDLEGQARYTSKDYQQAEDQALAYVNMLQEKRHSLPLSSALIQEKIGLIEQELTQKNKQTFSFSGQQKQAVETLCSNSLLSVMIGRAGTGKTTTLRPVVEAHKEAGFSVIGMSLSAAASENLGMEAGCSSETIAYYLDKWEKYEEASKKQWSVHTSQEQREIEKTLAAYKQHQLCDKHVLIIDEAGMVGTRIWEQLLHHAHKAGAKILAIGDDHQFKAIDAGDFFRKLIDLARAAQQKCSLDTIVRQKTDWMRQASHDLAELKTYTALATYEQQGRVRAIDGLTEVAQDYVQYRVDNPNQSAVLVAFTRIQVNELNQSVQQQLLEQNLVYPHQGQCEVNDRSMVVGDQMVFLKNDRRGHVQAYDARGKECSFMVKNGTIGKIESIVPVHFAGDHNQPPLDTHQITARIDNKTTVKFLLSDYSHVDHGYALTLSKSQGGTWDDSFVVGSRNMDAYATYVSLTRHRNNATFYYDKNDFTTFESLQQSLSRLGTKDLVIDYTIREENFSSWANVQEYLTIGREVSTMLQEKDWQGLKDLKDERKALGQAILEEWDNHRKYAMQGGLTQEVLQIACGFKARPLSHAEQIAQVTVEQYGIVSLQMRDLWNEIQKTHSGALAKQHSEYQTYDQLRFERGSLAQVIADYPALHRPFVREVSETLGYGMATIQKQAQAYIRCQEQHQLIEKLPSADQEKLQTIQAYLDARDCAAQAWQNVRQQLKDAEGTLLAATMSREIDQVKPLFEARDRLAYPMVEHLDDYLRVAKSVYLTLDPGKVLDQGLKGLRHICVEQYQSSNSQLAKSMAAYELYDQWQGEQVVGIKDTVRDILSSGINLTALSRDAQLYERRQLFITLPEADKPLFSLLENYEAASFQAKEEFKICLQEANKQGTKPWEAKAYGEFSQSSQARDQLAGQLISHPYNAIEAMASRLKISLEKIDLEAHRDYLRSVSETFLSGMGGKTAFAAQELKAWLDFDRGENKSHTWQIMKEMDYLPQDVLKALQTSEATRLKQAPQRYTAPIHAQAFPSRQETSHISEALRQNIQDLAQDLLGKPTSRGARHWRFGRKGSMVMTISGDKQGLYSNFESGEHGGPLKLIQEKLGLDYKGALSWAKDWLGQERALVQNPLRSSLEKPVEQKQSVAILPVPEKEANPDIVNNKYLNHPLKDRQETHRFAYRDANGRLLGYVIRLENQEGDKVTLPLTYCENSKGQRAWRWQGFGHERPLYGLEKLKDHPDKPILVVEGEKTADAAQKLLPAYTVVTWIGGTGSVKKVDWTPLAGKDVTIWPDNDEPGLKAAHIIKDKLDQVNLDRGLGSPVKIVDLPKDLPKKWDLADALPMGWTFKDIHDLVAPALNETSKGHDNKHQEQKTTLWQNLKETAKDLFVAKASSDHLYPNRPFIEKTVPQEFRDSQQFAQDSFERNLKYCRFILFKNEMGRMPTIEDLPQIQDMATRLSALEVSIYQDAPSQHKTDQQIVAQARQEFAFGKQGEEKIIKEMKVLADQKVLEVKNQMEQQQKTQALHQMREPER